MVSIYICDDDKIFRQKLYDNLKEKCEKIGLKSYKPCCIIGLKSKTVNHFAIKGENG